jgi:hypothetical protein
VIRAQTVVMVTKKNLGRRNTRKQSTDFGLLGEMDMIVPPQANNPPEENVDTDTTSVATNVLTETSAIPSPIGVSTVPPDNTDIGGNNATTTNDENNIPILNNANLDAQNLENNLNLPIPNADLNLPIQNANNRDNYLNFPIPQSAGHLNQVFILNNIIAKDELCFIKLKDLCETYFKHHNLLQLANLRYGTGEDGIGDSSFFVCIGTKNAYNKVLSIPFNKRDDKNKNLYIKTRRIIEIYLFLF